MEPSALKELTDKILQDPQFVEKLTDEQVVAAMKCVDPLGAIPKTKKKYVNMSITNWRDQYMRRFLVTSLVGYLWRLVAEYEPEPEIERLEKSFAGRKDADSVRELAAKKQLMIDTSRRLIRQFLSRHFQYNPDHHLMSSRGSNAPGAASAQGTAGSNASSTNVSDTSAAPSPDVNRACERAGRADYVLERMESRADTTRQYLKSNLLWAKSAIAESVDSIQACINAGDLPAEDRIGILVRRQAELRALLADMHKLTGPLETAETLDAWRVDPPADVFHHFDRYITNHYEQLREVVEACYSERPDIEFQVTLYDCFDTEDEAREHRIQNESLFRTSVVTVENGNLTLLGPFKQNRERIDFYSKNTELLQQMQKQLELDQKLGRDLVKKKAKNAKAKNIAEMGPDAPGLAQYAKVQNRVQELGATAALTKEEKKELEDKTLEAQRIKEDLETPDDTIRVDVFYTDADGEMKRGKMYTQAEKPLHLQEPDSEFRDRYQPVRPEGMALEEGYTTKVITSRDGKEQKIYVPKK